MSVGDARARLDALRDVFDTIHIDPENWGASDIIDYAEYVRDGVIPPRAWQHMMSSPSTDAMSWSAGVPIPEELTKAAE